MSRELRGYLPIAAAACLWGSSAAVARAVFLGRLGAMAAVDPFSLTQARNTIALLLLAPLVLLLRRGRIRMPARDLATAAALGILGISASNYFYYTAVARTNVATAVLIQYTAPVWVLLYGVLTGAEAGTRPRWAGVGLALLGIALLLDLGSPRARLRLDPVGVGCALAAAFAYAFYNLAGRSLSRRLDPLLIALYMIAAAAVFLALLHSPLRLFAATYRRGQLGFLIGFTVWATLAPTLLYINGLRHLDATRAVVTGGLEPVTGICLSAFLLGESLGWLPAVGALCVFAAIGLIQRAHQVRPQADSARASRPA